MTKIEKFKHWLYELDEQELCAGREKIMEFVKSLEQSNQAKAYKAGQKSMEGYSSGESTTQETEQGGTDD